MFADKLQKDYSSRLYNAHALLKTFLKCEFHKTKHELKRQEMKVW